MAVDLKNIALIKSKLPATVKLVAVSKTKPVSDILEVYETGQKIFGENRVQELLSKKDKLPADIEWHLIGHLQTNKVKSVVPFIGMIESVDSFRLLNAINHEAAGVNRVVDCLLQIHIAQESTKYGFSGGELHEGLASNDVLSMKNVRICGLMGMATFTSDKAIVEKEFSLLDELFRSLKNDYFSSCSYFTEKSMGMSGDFETAIKMGSTMVRIGSLIFGERNYH